MMPLILFILAAVFGLFVIYKIIKSGVDDSNNDKPSNGGGSGGGDFPDKPKDNIK